MAFDPHHRPDLRPDLRPVHRGRRDGWAAAALLLTATATGAAASDSVSGFMDVTISPGDTAQCQSNPCRVKLNIPAGEGSVVVTGNEVTWGTYPAGQTADLGEVFNSTAFEIKGMDVPKAWVYMPNEP